MDKREKIKERIQELFLVVPFFKERFKNIRLNEETDEFEIYDLSNDLSFGIFIAPPGGMILVQYFFSHGTVYNPPGWEEKEILETLSDKVPEFFEKVAAYIAKEEVKFSIQEYTLEKMMKEESDNNEK